MARGLDGAEVFGTKIYVMMVKKEEFFTEYGSNTLFINKIPRCSSDRDLYNSFEKHGELLFCEVC